MDSLLESIHSSRRDAHSSSELSNSCNRRRQHEQSDDMTQIERQTLFIADRRAHFGKIHFGGSYLTYSTNMTSGLQDCLNLLQLPD